MTSRDLFFQKELLHFLTVKKFEIKTIAIHSAWQPQIDAIIEVTGIKPEILDIDKWNLYNESNFKFDLILFANIFSYLDKPEIAFKNVFKSCKYTIIQDIIIRNRSGVANGIFGDECMRYSYKEIKSDYHGAFNLEVYDKRILSFLPYVNGEPYTNFIVLMKGDL